MRTIRLGAGELAGLASEIVSRGSPLAFRVQGASMLPALASGDRVVLAPAEPGDLVPGEIVMTSGSRPLVHRLVRVELETRTLVTRGDALDEDDPPVPFELLVGRVVAVKRPLLSRARRRLGRLLRVLGLR
ncbi:MAG: S24/S26 family peptidase [Deltaproteobacteria bacterium]|nr:S24/S26 family peptidase [Deltaproteobacteria bacterium]